VAKPAIEEISSPRLLSKFIDPVSFFFNDPPSTPSTVFGSGWEILDSASTYDSLLVWRGFIDLAGYVEQEKTLFLNGVNIAEAGVIAGNAPLTTVDLVTKRRVSTSQLESYGAAGFSDGATDLYPAGFLGTTHDMDSVLYGRLRYLMNGGRPQPPHLNGSTLPGSCLYGTTKPMVSQHGDYLKHAFRSMACPL